MATVNTTSILGSDSISGSRTTINSNFLLLQNWINNYYTVFGLDTINGIIDLTGASTGRISAKTGKFDSIIVPSGGTALAQINSSGAGSFASLSTTALSASGIITFGPGSTLTQSGTSTFTGNTTLSGATTLNALTTLGPLGNFASQNSVGASGATAGTAFPDSATGGGGGRGTSVSNPYFVTGLEDVIYAQCSSGFYLSVGTTGATAANLPAGLRITIINTETSTGSILTGVQGSNYTGFNTVVGYGQFPSTGITVDANRPYQSSVQLQWEPRVGKGTGSQEGSWVVLSATNMSWT
jgi:hypothetical protein